MKFMSTPKALLIWTGCILLIMLALKIFTPHFLDLSDVFFVPVFFWILGVLFIIIANAMNGAAKWPFGTKEEPNKNSQEDKPVPTDNKPV